MATSPSDASAPQASATVEDTAFANSLAFFLGALAAEVVWRRRPAEVDATATPVASGFIGGESLMGVPIAVAIAVLAQ